MLNIKQIKVAKALYEGKLSEDEICQQLKLPRLRLRKWLALDEFQRELQRLCDNSKREAEFAISRFAPVAALRLVELLGSDKPDIARRAALDLMDRCLQTNKSPENSDKPDQQHNIPEEQARQMLLTLAEGMKSEEKEK